MSQLFDRSKFETNKDFFNFLIENKDSLIAQKKAETKHADAICSFSVIGEKNIEQNKANDPVDVSNVDKIKVKVIINTTNLLDRHGDVHIRGIWKKSLQENKMIMHLQEHDMAFDKIIADGKNLKTYVKDYNWSELGAPFTGITQALVFESTIERKRNEFMFNQYANGYVRNHSVGMRYVKFDLAINDEDYPNEYDAWNKYIQDIANKEQAIENGMFWYVTEAKVIEGSAVPLGSNWITPTEDNNLKSEPSIQDTHNTDNEPPKQGTQKSDIYKFLIQNLKQ